MVLDFGYGCCLRLIGFDVGGIPLIGCLHLGYGALGCLLIVVVAAGFVACVLAYWLSCFSCLVLVGCCYFGFWFDC